MIPKSGYRFSDKDHAQPKESSPEIGLAYLGAARELVGPAGGDHASLREHVAVVGDGQRLVHVLLDQEHGDAASVDLAHDIEILLDQERRQPERGLIDEQ